MALLAAFSKLKSSDRGYGVVVAALKNGAAALERGQDAVLARAPSCPAQVVSVRWAPPSGAAEGCRW